MKPNAEKYYTFIEANKNADLRKLFDSLSAQEQRAIYEGYAYAPDEMLWEGYEMPYGMPIEEYHRRVVNDPNNYELFLSML